MIIILVTINRKSLESDGDPDPDYDYDEDIAEETEMDRPLTDPNIVSTAEQPSM